MVILAVEKGEDKCNIYPWNSSNLVEERGDYGDILSAKEM